MAYQQSKPDCTAAEMSKYAKDEERRVRSKARSLDEYHGSCAKAMESLLSSRPDHTANVQADEPEYQILPTTGVQIGRYSNAQHFRDGLFSEIFKASVPEPEQTETSPSIVALKMTNPTISTPPHDSVREARILAAAKGDHIIPLIETFQQAGGRFVIACPFMPHDLEILLQRNQLTERSRRSILKDVFTGLAHLHSLNIIHRDMKPSNILLASPNGPAYIADFGIAWSSSDPASEPADEKILDVGTTCYRPPELLFGNQKYGEALDIWATGCLAAQVVSLHGKTLFNAGDLGSELALIKSIFETLGTPDMDVWPEADTFPDWGKMNFAQYPGKLWTEILPSAESAAVDLVSQLVRYESRHRMTAANALAHPYLRQPPP